MKSKHYTTRLSKGFTLLEMMVIAVIVGILTTLAVARYMEVKDKGMVGAAVYDLDLVRKLLAYYCTEYDTYPDAVVSYDDLKSQLVDLDGNSMGEYPTSNTFTWLTYELDSNNDYVVRVQAPDHHNTILVATPTSISRE